MDTIRIGPQPGPQTQFLSTPADIAIYGGAAGGGKTWGLILEPLRHSRNPGFGAVIFRQTYRQVTQQGGMWDEASGLYPYVGGKPYPGVMRWKFPSGARVSFAYMQTEDDKKQYDGAQIPLIGFDQLEHFSESQFFYMLGRNRSLCGVAPYIRATCNPDADSFLAKLLAWWINQETGYPIPERGGVLRWFIRIGEEIFWGDSKDELAGRNAEIPPKSITFIPASVYDNKILLEKDPGYIANLFALQLVERERLLRGNWKIRAGAGKVYNRQWYEIVPASPVGGQVCRFWDFASTEKKMEKSDPDYTAGVMIKLLNGAYFIEDSTAFQDSPVNTEKRFINQTIQDYNRCKAHGEYFMVRWELEPGSASRRDAIRMVQALTKAIPGIDALAIESRGDKITRGKALSTQSEAGNVKVVQGEWNEDWLNHMHGQPDLKHDDIHDGSTGAFNALGNQGWSRGMAN